MPIPAFIVELRRLVGTTELWLPGVTAVVRRGDEVLLVQRSDNLEWTPVTGIVDPGEEPAVAARREALEETGVEITVDRLASVGVVGPVTYPNGDRTSYLDHVFACTWVSGEARVADDESVDVAWFPVDALPQMRDDPRERIAAAWAGEERARFRV
ncbi:NUDIX domain-containing protein [Nocardioides sp. GCM10027113]|uniref:NUDIX hydrolase n=1 Tax=unclassified Nocardioides TaxID=2615069 RepID=UPI00361B1595